MMAEWRKRNSKPTGSADSHSFSSCSSWKIWLMVQMSDLWFSLLLLSLSPRLWLYSEEMILLSGL